MSATRNAPGTPIEFQATVVKVEATREDKADTGVRMRPEIRLRIHQTIDAEIFGRLFNFGKEAGVVVTLQLVQGKLNLFAQDTEDARKEKAAKGTEREAADHLGGPGTSKELNGKSGRVTCGLCRNTGTVPHFDPTQKNATIPCPTCHPVEHTAATGDAPPTP